MLRANLNSLQAARAPRVATNTGPATWIGAHAADLKPLLAALNLPDEKALDVEPVFPKRDQAIDYTHDRAY